MGNYLVEPEALSDTIRLAEDSDKLLIVDLCQAQLYDRLHIPGAVHLPFGKLTSGVQPATGSLPSVERIIDALTSIGYSPDKKIIAYDDEGGGWAGRFIWTLDLFGHQHSSYLNGGIHNWLLKKLPTETGEEARQRLRSSSLSHLGGEPVGSLSIRRPEVAVTKDYLLENYQKPSVVVWDARSPEEYSGIRQFAKRAGHIPGAVNYEWTRAMDTNNGLTIRALEMLKEELGELGITEDKEIITHCQTHHRSGFTYLLGKILGFPNMKAYAGSWSEWGNDLNVPIEADT